VPFERRMEILKGQLAPHFTVANECKAGIWEYVLQYMAGKGFGAADKFLLEISKSELAP